jgi:hypothetical protein
MMHETKSIPDLYWSLEFNVNVCKLNALLYLITFVRYIKLLNLNSFIYAILIKLWWSVWMSMH